MWDALQAVCGERGCTMHELCTSIEQNRGVGQSLTSAVRVALLRHYRFNGETFPKFAA